MVLCSQLEKGLMMKLPKKLPALGDPKCPPAVVTGQKVKKLPSLNDPKSPAAKVVGQTVRKLPPLGTTYSSNKAYNGGT
jgi:hypothetical protein